LSSGDADGTVMIRELLRRHRDEVARTWFEDTLSAYPARAVEAWVRERDPFANPVGHGLRVGTGAVVDWLLGDGDAHTMRRGLDDILRVRAVQELSPGDALRFVFRLKAVLRAELGEALADPTLRQELAGLEARIDEIGLEAFELFLAHRERLYELRVAELKRTIPWIAARDELAAAEREAGR